MFNSESLIPLMVLIPLLGGVGIAFLPGRSAAAVRTAAMIWSLLTLAASIVIACRAFEPVLEQHGMVPLTGVRLFFRSTIPWIDAFGLRFSFGIDSISLWLVLLTTGLTPLVILGSFSAITDRVKEFHVWLLLLEAAMLGTFVATDLIFFYICFEFTLVPLFFLIGIYGSTQRLQAAKVFFLYTFTGSMLTFAGVLYTAWFNAQITGVWTFSIPQLTTAAQAMPFNQQTWVLLALLAGFAVKVPLFPFHTWLPLAHTEAPTAGSVILAGVLLKLGTYGLLRFALPMTPQATVEFAPYIGTLAVVGILYTALICWVQKDIKKLIAYSSVSHLGFCVLGMFALNTIGVAGSVMYMINHGLSTGAMFLCVGMIYERFHTREMARLGGLAKTMPVWSFFMVFFCLASVGLPGLNGFVGEFLTLMGAFLAHDILGVRYAAVAGVGMILGAIYILYMVGRVVFGSAPTHDEHHSTHHADVADLNLREIFALVPLAAACLLLGWFPTPLLRTLEAPIAGILEPVQTVLTQRDHPWALADAPTPIALTTTHPPHQTPNPSP